MTEDATGNLLIEHDQSAGQISYTIPLSYTASITNTNIVSKSLGLPADFSVASFHTAVVGDPTNCDTLGPYDFLPIIVR